MTDRFVDPAQIPDGPTMEVYYDKSQKDYLLPDKNEKWIRVNETSLRRHLRELGFSATVQKGDCVSEVDKQINQIQRNSNVAFAGPLAGHRKGYFEFAGEGILVTSSPRLIESNPGEWSVLEKFLSNLFSEQERPYVFGWLKLGYESLRDNTRRVGQALALAGEPACGKSLFQRIVTDILGGRVAKPYLHMSGKTEFNAELFSAEHLSIEDEVPSTDFRSRHNFGCKIKQFAVNEEHSCHPKNRQAITLQPFWRVTISVNDDPEHLQVLPPFDENTYDKIILVKAHKAEMPMPTYSNEDRNKFWKTIHSELPAFLDYLTKWEIPTNLRGQRFGIETFHNTELLSALDELSPETRLLGVIDAAFERGPLNPEGFHGRAEELQSILAEWPNAYGARQLLTHPNAIGNYLSRLASKHPSRVTQLPRTATARLWKITPPAKAITLKESPHLSLSSV